MLYFFLLEYLQVLYTPLCGKVSVLFIMQYQSNIKADLNVHVILKGFDTYSYSYFLKNVLISLWRITLNKDIKNIQVSKVKYLKSFLLNYIF